jgi:hypothetical protein
MSPACGGLHVAFGVESLAEDEGFRSAGSGFARIVAVGSRGAR